MGSLRSLRTEAVLGYRKRARHHSWQSVLARRLERRLYTIDRRIHISHMYMSDGAGRVWIFWGSHLKRLYKSDIEVVVKSFLEEKSEIYPKIELKIQDMSEPEEKDEFLIIDGRYSL